MGKKVASLEITQRSIVLELLRNDRPERWTHAELARRVNHGKDPWIVAKAIGRLEAAGVVRSEGDQVWASQGTRRLDSLEMFGI